MEGSGFSLVLSVTTSCLEMGTNMVSEANDIILVIIGLRLEEGHAQISGKSLRSG